MTSSLSVSLKGDDSTHSTDMIQDKGLMSWKKFRTLFIDCPEVHPLMK